MLNKNFCLVLDEHVEPSKTLNVLTQWIRRVYKNIREGVLLLIDFSKVISEERVIMGEQTKEITTKKTLFEAMADTFLQTSVITSVEDFMEALNDRETQGSTYMGNCIAIPHGQNDSVIKSGLAICRLDNPIEYQSCGEKGLIKFVFMFAIEKSKAGTEYLKILAELARMLMDQDFINKIESASNEKSILKSFI